MTDGKSQREWDMSEERAFIENLVVQRFNFFLLFFTLIVAGAVGVKNETNLKAVLIVGAAVSCMITYTLIIANMKLNHILDRLDSKHPFRVIEKEVGLSGRNWIGYWIPVICSFVLIAACFLALCGHVAVSC